MALFDTNDIALASYLMLRGLVLKSADVSPTGKYIFIFEDPTDMALSMSIDFINSECCKFDNQMRNLRKILNRKINSSKSKNP